MIVYWHLIHMVQDERDNGEKNRFRVCYDSNISANQSFERPAGASLEAKPPGERVYMPKPRVEEYEKCGPWVVGKKAPMVLAFGATQGHSLNHVDNDRLLIELREDQIDLVPGLYHGTKADNIDGIASNGLIPGGLDGTRTMVYHSAFPPNDTRNTWFCNHHYKVIVTTDVRLFYEGGGKVYVSAETGALQTDYVPVQNLRRIGTQANGYPRANGAEDTCVWTGPIPRAMQRGPFEIATFERFDGQASVRKKDIPLKPPEADEDSAKSHRRMVKASTFQAYLEKVECEQCRRPFTCGLHFCPNCKSQKKYALFKWKTVHRPSSSEEHALEPLRQSAVAIGYNWDKDWSPVTATGVRPTIAKPARRSEWGALNKLLRNNDRRSFRLLFLTTPRNTTEEAMVKDIIATGKCFATDRAGITRKITK